MIKRSHLIGVAARPELEAMRIDGGHVPQTVESGPCISGTQCPDYAMSDGWTGTLHCTICGTTYGAEGAYGRSS